MVSAWDLTDAVVRMGQSRRLRRLTTLGTIGERCLLSFWSILIRKASRPGDPSRMHLRDSASFGELVRGQRSEGVAFEYEVLE